jgi:hypothetical protein
MRDPIDSILSLHERLALPPLTEMPGHIWRHAAGSWRFVFNGSEADIKDRGITIPAFHVYVEYLGWPAGILDPTGQGQFVASALANPDTFCAALDAEGRS